MVDGVGTTTYGYHDIPDGPSGSPGVGDGRLASIDGPWANDTIAYNYDELGRVVERTINTTANETDINYDALGRVNQIANPLGTFTYGYVNATGRLASIAYPNGQATNFDYWPNTAASAGNGDQRLKEIENLSALSSNLSTFTYSYDVDGTITDWTRKYDAGSVLTSAFKYDAADQLTEASVPTVASVLEQFVYRHDKAANRTSEQIDNAVNAGTHNKLNQLTSLSATGPVRFAGSLNEVGTVTVNGQAVPVAGDNSFSGDVSLPPGSNSVAVVAKDPLNNTRTNNYTVAVASGTSRTLAYDLVGNMTDNGDGQTYEWDAVNRLTKITLTGGARTEFTYDGLDRRVKIVEKNSGGSTTSEKHFVWDGLTIAEERDGSNVPTKRFYKQGRMVGSAEFYYTADHLGSIHELTDDTGAIHARYDYDPHGRTTKISGSGDAEFRYTGHYFHAVSGLHVAPYRLYDATLGEWLSRDPIEEQGGVNLYSYVNNDPLGLSDPLGLQPYLPDPAQKPPGWDPSWPTGRDSRGEHSRDPNSGTKYYPHPEDKGHWPHYDDDSGKRYPPNAKKPWPNQKRPCKPDQSPTNPWPGSSPKNPASPRPPAVPTPPWWLRIPFPPFIIMPGPAIRPNPWDPPQMA